MRSEPRESLSSHWTIAVSERSFLIGLGVLFLFHLILSAILPPAEDELYYWAWSRHLGFSYYDHPPLIAYLIRISTTIFGNSMFGVRFFGPVTAFLVLLILRQLCDGTSLLVPLILTPMFLLGAVLITPDTPLLFFWVAYLVWLTQINRVLAGWSDDPVTRVYHKTPLSLGHWLIGGFLLGMGFLGKYTMLLAAPCAFVVLLSRHQFRAWIAGFGLHCVVAALFAIPVVIFNFQHNFASFNFQYNNALQGPTGWHLNTFLEFLSSQILLIGALPFFMFPWILISRRELSDNARSHACFYFFVLPILFFLFQSFRQKLEANWALVAYLGFWPIAQHLLDRTSFRSFAKILTVLSFIVPILFSIAVLIHLVLPFKSVPPGADRLHKLAAQYQTSQTIADDIKKVFPGIPVYAGTYQWVSYLRYQGLEAKQVHWSGRDTQFTLDKKSGCEESELILISESEDGGTAGGTLQCFPNRAKMKDYPVTVRGTEVGRLFLTKYSK